MRANAVALKARIAVGTVTKNTTVFCIVSVVSIVICVSASGNFSPVSAQANSPTPTPTPMVKPAREPLSEADPTKPILWVVRNEFKDQKNGAWANFTVVRHDRFTFRNLGVKGGAKGLVLRFEVPIAVVHAGNTTKAGLGDIYAQVLYAPRISRRFVFTFGSGVVLPTATDKVLGAGKVIVAPLAVPLWYLANKHRLVTVRVQHYVSVAGSGSRPNVNYTVVDPSVGLAISRNSWLFINTELKWDWRTKRDSGISGVQFGHMLTDNIGFWFKPEFPWGPGRTSDLNLKFGIFRFR